MWKCRFRSWSRDRSFPRCSSSWRSLRFPKPHWQKIGSNNPIERLNKEIERGAGVVEVFPNPAAFLRLATAVVIEAHDEWQVARS